MSEFQRLGVFDAILLEEMLKEGETDYDSFSSPLKSQIDVNVLIERGFMSPEGVLNTTKTEEYFHEYKKHLSVSE